VSTENKQTTSGGDSVTNLIEGLSRRAEAALSQRAGPSHKAFAALSPESAQQLLHDLQVHQIELEMQNQELRRTQAELDTSRSHYFDFYDLAPVGYCTLNESGLILQANLKTTTMLGVAKKDLPSRTLSRFIFAEDQDHFFRLRQLAMASRDLQECEVRLVKQDGTQLWVRLHAQVIDGGGMQHLGLVLTDITSYKQLQRELRDANEELARQSELRYRTPIDVEVQSERLRLLYEASQRLSSTLDLNEIYRIIDDFMSAIAPDCDFLVSAFDPDTQLITCRAFVMNRQALDVSAFPPIPLEEEGRGTQSLVIRSGKSLLLNDYQAALKTARTSYFVNDQTHELDEQVDPEEEVAQSALIVPLKVGEQVTGVVQVMSYCPNAFSEEQLQLLESLALHIAVAKQNAQLYARVQYELEQRKLAEAELRESEASLNEAQAQAQIGSYVTTIKTGIWQASATLRQIFGIDSSFVTSVENWGKLMAPGYQQRMLDYYQSVVEGDGKFDMEYEVIRPGDGQRRWVHALGRLVYDGNGKPVFLKGTIQDITERKLAEESQRIAAVAFESQQAMFITDPQQLILRINKGFSEITGYTAEEAVGQTPRLLSSGKHGADFYAAMWECVSRTGQWHGEIWNRRKNGTIYPQQLNVSTVKNAQGLLTHYVGTFSDITSARAAEEQIESLAYSDLLTGLPNRRRLIIQLQQAMIAGEDEKRQGALLLVDLDHFKSLNDALGHKRGDLLLQQMAMRLNACVHEGESVARVGGDEFVVLLKQLDQSKLEAAMYAETTANKILAAIRKPYQIDGAEVSCNASIGIALFGEQHEDTVEPLKRAELAMYEAKERGRNTLRFFDAKMQAAVNSRVTMEAALREAITSNQFLLHYQAQVTELGRITGVEALLRWLDPNRGMVSPAEFIPLAEEDGLILPIGDWVLETACRQLARWAGQPDRAHLTVAVNISARQFHQRDFVDRVLLTLERTGANPYRLKLELTESLLISDVADVIAKMDALKARGVCFSLDDFGTGYSSLTYLKRLPLDQLKIDQSFVRDILVDPDDAAIARTVVALADSLGLVVIAEGVETAAQRDFLASLGCHHYQGYLFSRPLPIQEFEAFATRF
jgi:diguanylate cyclase (GGDEF)-like protein/PAS domain S-box-containing protein